MENAKTKIILADGNTVNSAMGSDILGTFFEVYPAPSSAAFFEILEKVTPELILLNMKLPELDGDETIKKIKADKRFADIPVIMLSSENDTAHVLEGFRLGAADCVPEPISGPLLLKCIASHLLIIQKNKVTAICGKAEPTPPG